MKKRIILPVAAAVIVLLLVTALLLLKQKKYSPDARSDTLSAEELAIIRPGDIILRKGKSVASDFITVMMGGPLKVSHCGLIVEDEGELSVIHSVSVSLSDYDGIQIQKLSDFIMNSQPDSHIVVRYKADDSTIYRIIEKARILLTQKLPFDNEFRLDNGLNLYCSELFWEILPENFRQKAVSFKFDQIIAFESFVNPEVFTVLINHPQNGN
ncbi:MAG: hypothetical protein JW874_07785 [Spirochaetales bacterium]|nr:hypothetical protein [Spirochaetales bacterium]